MSDDALDRKDTRTFIKDIYALFFFRAFKAPVAVWKFMRSVFHGLLKPGALNPREDCGPEKRYLSDVRLAEALFSLTIVSAVGNFMSQNYEKAFAGEELQGLVKLFGYFIAYLQNAYLLWLFSSVLVAAIFAERWWLRITKADFLPRRELATLFVYEACVLILPLLAIMFFAGYELYGPVSQDLFTVFIIYAIFAGIHLLIFFFRLGMRAGITILRRTLTPFLIVYLLVFAWMPGLLVTLPFYLLPLLLILYPLYALLRDYVPKPAIVQRFFDKIQQTIEIQQWSAG